MKGNVSSESVKGALNSPQSVSGKAVPRGNDGISPVVSVIDIEGGHRVVITDIEGEKTFDIMDGGKGDPGYTPQKNKDYFDGKGVYIVDVKESTELGGANVVTFSDGTTLTVMNGTIEFKDLTDEEKASLKGEDGYTPQKNVDYFDGYTPQKNVDYFDGKDGKDGEDGKDGYTPQKNVDYWTYADRQQMVSDVLNSLPTWNGGSY